jgi:hypothetical protein
MYIDAQVPVEVDTSSIPSKPSELITDIDSAGYSWEDINNIALLGLAQEYFALGATKTLELSSTYLGMDSITMMIIGFDCDGSDTVTFQTQNCFNTLIYQTGSSPIWDESTFRTKCQDLYSICAAKDYIKPVMKGYAVVSGETNDSAISYIKDTVFLPSAGEVGFTSDTDDNAVTFKEFNKENTDGTAY